MGGKNDGELAVVEVTPAAAPSGLDLGDLVLGLSGALRAVRAHMEAGDLVGQLGGGVVGEHEGVVFLGVKDLEGEGLGGQLVLQLGDSVVLFHDLGLGRIQLDIR